MKVAILLVFSALQGAALAADAEEIQVPDISGANGIPTGVNKLVKELIEIYENMSKVPTDDSSDAGTEASTESVFGSTERGKQGKEITRMKEDIAQIEAAFKAAVSPSYDRMSGRKLWKELMKKQKLLQSAKDQLQHLLNVKQEKLNKLRGKPSKYNIPSKELSYTILSYIDEIVAFRPANPSL